MRIGLVLSGGAARGFAHLGVFKALEELHIPVHIISGTSSGAMAGALYSAGYSPDEIFRMVSETNIVRLMRPAFSKMGLMNLDEVEKVFTRFLQHKTFAHRYQPGHSGIFYRRGHRQASGGFFLRSHFV
jgi:NTE family protein